MSTLNSEVFERYGSEQWVIEQNLGFLLMDFWNQLHEKGYVNEAHCPLNLVGVVKAFMKEETLIDIPWAEKSLMEHLDTTVVAEVDCVEVRDETNP